MAYLLLDLDLDDAIPPVELSDAQDGIGVLVRRNGAPIGWFMEPLAPGTALAAEELGRLVTRESASAVVMQTLRAALSHDRPAPAPASPSVTFGVCTRDRPAGLDRLLDSLAPLLVTEELKFEVLVVDNASVGDRTREVAVAHGARYVREPRLGLDFARNRAAGEATGDWLVFFDDDVVVDPGWLAAFRAMLAEHPDASAVTGSVVPLALDTPAQVLFEQRGGFRTSFVRTRFQGTAPTDLAYPACGAEFGTGANMAIRKDVLAALGGFDEALDTGPPLPGGGDLDMFVRVVRAGLVLVFEPSCLVFHEHRRDMAALYRQLGRSWGRSYLAVWNKTYRVDPWLRPRLRLHLCRWFYGLARRLARDLLRPEPTSAPLLTLAEIWGAIVGLTGTYRRSQRRSEAIRRTVR